MWPFNKRKQEIRMTLEELLLQAGISSDNLTKEQALNVPAVSGCIEVIANTVAMLPIKLYKANGNKTEEILNDNRLKLLNDDTGDTLDPFMFKKAIIEDYFLNGGAYVYVNRKRNKVASLNYVEHNQVSVNLGVDPIFKSYDINVNGASYRDYEFLKIFRKTKNGSYGRGLLSESNQILSTAYNSLVFENVLVKTGGNKKGFIKSQGKLSAEAIATLKDAWKNLYQNNTENVIVLNNGLEFQEASNTSVEMQLNQNKITNSAEICKLFTVPPSILEGKASETEYNNFIKICILPILTAIQTALNKDLLLKSEQGSFYFAFDTKELLKGDIEKRYRAYEIAIKNKILGVNEVRYEEDKEPIQAFEDTVVLGLQDVLYNVKTGAVYTPNTDKQSNMNASKNNEDELKGGEKEDEDRNPGQPGTA